jgi:hypothetical protein
LLEAEDLAQLDGHGAERFRDMCDAYSSFIQRERERIDRRD